MKCVDCSSDAVGARVRCQRHLDMSTARTKRHQQANKDKGRCPCGKERAADRKYCRQCLDVAWSRTQPKHKEMKHLAVLFLGGLCKDCGLFHPEFPEIFDFHHMDPAIKDDKVSSLIARGRKWEVILAELLKCVLLCANCHRIRHAKESQCLTQSPSLPMSKQAA